jgi:3-hydroxymyristoyl/3-hydroxydecanoyl-(acyl carrier protein) dehydratase
VSDAPLATTDLRVAPNDPCLTGHFPDRAVVPAAAILDRLAAWLSTAAQTRVQGVARARIKLALPPGTTWQVTAQPPAEGRIKVTCTQDGRTAMTATFVVDAGNGDTGGDAGGDAGGNG